MLWCTGVDRSVSFGRVEPPEPPEQVRVVLEPKQKVRVVFGSGGFFSAGGSRAEKIGDFELFL